MRKTTLALVLIGCAHIGAAIEIPFLPQGPGGTVRNLVFQGSKVVAAGYFEGADDVATRGIALWDGSKWNPLGKGLRKQGQGATVTALHADAERIYVCGDFDSAGTVSAPGNAVWDGARWASLAGSGACNALVTWKGKVVALYWGTRGGGQFLMSWTGEAWIPLSPQPPGSVTGLAVHDDVLWVSTDEIIGSKHGGNFLYLHDTGWTSPFGRLEGGNRRFGFAGGALYASSVLEDEKTHIYRGENGHWVQVGDAATDRHGTMATDGNSVYRLNRDALGVASIEVLESEGFKTLVTSLEQYYMVDLAAHEGRVFLLGGFRAPVPGGVADNLAAFDGKAWKGVTGGLRPGPKGVGAASSWGTRLYMGGSPVFYPTEGRNSPIASWDGKNWDFLQQARTDGRGFASVTAIEASGDNVYVGGIMDTLPDGRPARGIARWDGKAWHPMGEGYPKGVRDILVSGTVVYAGGDANLGPTVSPSHPLYGQCLGRWNGTTWEKLGGGIGGSMVKMAVHAGQLYVLGRLTLGPSSTEVSLAVWDGKAWQAPLVELPDNTYDDLVSFQGSLYLAGTFPYNNDLGYWVKAGLARLEGDHLVRIDSVPEGGTSVLAADDRFLYYASVNILLAWDGKSRWHPVQLGTNNWIGQMNLHEGKLFLAGGIMTIEGMPAYGFAIWDPGTEVGIRPIIRGGAEASRPGLQRLRLPGGSPVSGAVRGDRVDDLKGRRLRTQAYKPGR